MLSVSETYLQSTSSGCSWWSSDVNDYEYCSAPISGNWQTARVFCQDQGGVLAYKGFGDSATYDSIYQNAIAPTGAGNYMFGAYYDNQRVLRGLDGEALAWQNYRSGEPKGYGGCIRICDTVAPSKWCEQNCLQPADPVRGAVCQRPKGETLELCCIFVEWKTASSSGLILTR